MFSAKLSSQLLKIFVWASLVSQIVIVITGGAVRLTGSGLGCPTWPTCTSDSLVTVPAMGLHGVIEFTNRMLTFVLLVIAGVTLWFAFRTSNRRVRFTAIALIGGIFLQAVIGGISVLDQLNPWIVGLHFVVSAVMIAVASYQLSFVYDIEVANASQSELVLSKLLVWFGGLTIVIGVLVTGSGPHAGDAATRRNGLDSVMLQHYHSWPAYIALGLAIYLLVKVRRRDVDGLSSRLVFWTTATIVLQALVGVAQARLGLPIWMVLVHLSLASVLVSLITLQFVSIKQ